MQPITLQSCPSTGSSSSSNMAHFFGVVLDIRQELQQLRDRLEKSMEGFLISGQVGAHNKLPARTRNEIANDDLFLSHELQQCKNWKNRHKKCPTFWA